MTQMILDAVAEIEQLRRSIEIYLGEITQLCADNERLRAALQQEIKKQSEEIERLWGERASDKTEIERLTTENWQLRQAFGYPIPADKDTPQNPFKCGVCDARALEQKP